MSIEIAPFESEMLDQAGELLALRHRHQRTLRPELPASFEQFNNARAAVEAVWKRSDASGYAAMSSGRMLGYLIGDRVMNELWGAVGGCVMWAVPLRPIKIRRLCVIFMPRLVITGSGHTAVIITLPPSEEALVSKWFALAFGIEHIYSLVALDTLDLSPRPAPAGLKPDM